MKAERTLSPIIAAIIPFPLLITGIASTYEKIPAQVILGGLAGAVIVWIIGTLFGVLLSRSKGKRIYITRFSTAAAGIVLTVLSEIVILILGMGSLAPVFIPAAYVFWFWLAFRVGSRQSVISPIVLGGYGVEAAFMYPICNSFNHKAAVSIIIITAVVTVFGALLINFRQVSVLSLRGKSENKLLTKSCARFNIKATLIFCGIVLFAFFFCGIGARWLWEGIKAAARFIVYLMSLFGSMIDKAEYDPGETPDSPFMQITENEGSKYLIWILAIILAVIFFKPFVKKIKNLYRRIMTKLGKTDIRTEELQYTDIYQDSSTGGMPKDTFKKAYKAFLKERNNTKKYRLGYKAFMVGLSEKELDLYPSDTPKEHCEKGRALIQDSKLDSIVDKYCSVRYDDINPNREDCEAMRELLKEIRRA